MTKILKLKCKRYLLDPSTCNSSVIPTGKVCENFCKRIALQKSFLLYSVTVHQLLWHTIVYTLYKNCNKVFCCTVCAQCINGVHFTRVQWNTNVCAVCWKENCKRVSLHSSFVFSSVQKCNRVKEEAGLHKSAMKRKLQELSLSKETASKCKNWVCIFAKSLHFFISRSVEAKRWRGQKINPRAPRLLVL